MQGKRPGGTDAGGPEVVVFEQVVNGDAPFMHLVRIDRGDGIGIERDGHQTIGVGRIGRGARVRAHQHAQRFRRMEMDCPCPCSASTSAMVTAASESAESEDGSQPRMEVRFMKSSTPRPEAKRAERAVGSTWLEPPT